MACAEKINNELQHITEEIEKIRNERKKQALLIMQLAEDNKYKKTRLYKLYKKKAELKNKLKISR